MIVTIQLDTRHGDDVKALAKLGAIFGVTETRDALVAEKHKRDRDPPLPWWQTQRPVNMGFVPEDERILRWNKDLFREQC